MRLSNTSQYAINIMVAIAEHKETKLLNAKSISDTFDIPYKYLTRIMPQLVEAKFIISTRGREGGYSLAKEASSISIINILNAVNDSLHASKCILKPGMCDANNKCALHDSWMVPNKSIKIMFNQTTLESITNL
ncbi:MAG: Rrf2 family transcriptional regulator [Methylococcales bacterium]|nr:Rrf2 family transcriptional regulator [Methylococcales bacterium]